MKVGEAIALKLFEYSGLPHPQFALLPNGDLNFQSTKVVVKANIVAGSKKKSGLVEIGQFDQLDKLVKSVLEKSSSHLPFDSVLTEEFIAHEDEYFVSLRKVREGIEILYSEKGGIEVENNWEEVDKVLLPTQKILDVSWGAGLEVLTIESNIVEFLVNLVNFFVKADAVYMEINPFCIVNGKCIPLGIVLELDEAAEYRHPEWEKLKVKDQSAKIKTEREKIIEELDSQIKGSVKLVEAGGNTALLAAGAGAALYLADAIIDHGLTFANYAEFSGNPPNFAITKLTKQVCAIPGIKNLVIGSGIANFTPVKPNFEAIIDGLKNSPAARYLHIVVRRCGPGEQEGIDLMKSFAKESGYNVEVFGRETGMTEIVGKL